MIITKERLSEAIKHGSTIWDQCCTGGIIKRL